MKVPVIFILWNDLARKVTISLSPESLSSRLSIFPKDKLSHRDSLILMFTGRVSVISVVPDRGSFTAQVPLAPSLQLYEEHLQELWTFNSYHNQNFSFSHFLFLQWLLTLQNAMCSKNFRNVWEVLKLFVYSEPERTINWLRQKLSYSTSHLTKQDIVVIAQDVCGTFKTLFCYLCILNLHMERSQFFRKYLHHKLFLTAFHLRYFILLIWQLPS